MKWVQLCSSLNILWHCPSWDWKLTFSSPVATAKLIQERKKERKKVKLLSRVQLFATPWTVACQAPLSMEFSRVLEWLAIPFSRGSSHPRDWIQVSCIAGGFFTMWATKEAHTKYKHKSKNLMPMGRDMLPDNVKIYFPSGHTWLHSQQMYRKTSLLRQFARTGHWII